MAENDLALALPDATAGSGSQQPWAHGNLITQAEGVGSVSPCWKEFGIVHPGDGCMKIAGVRPKLPQKRMIRWDVIQTTPRPADVPSLAVTGKRLVHSGARAEVAEILRHPDTTMRPRPDAVEDGGVNRISVCFHGFLSE